jgi:hypothetical protein
MLRRKATFLFFGCMLVAYLLFIVVDCEARVLQMSSRSQLGWCSEHPHVLSADSSASAAVSLILILIGHLVTALLSVFGVAALAQSLSRAPSAGQAKSGSAGFTAGVTWRQRAQKKMASDSGRQEGKGYTQPTVSVPPARTALHDVVATSLKRRTSAAAPIVDEQVWSLLLAAYFGWRMRAFCVCRGCASFASSGRKKCGEEQPQLQPARHPLPLVHPVRVASHFRARLRRGILQALVGQDRTGWVDV